MVPKQMRMGNFIVYNVRLIWEISMNRTYRGLPRLEEGSYFKILTDKPTGKRLLGRHRRRWEDIFRMDLKEMGVNTRNWVDSAQDRIIGEPL